MKKREIVRSRMELDLEGVPEEARARWIEEAKLRLMRGIMQTLPADRYEEVEFTVGPQPKDRIYESVQNYRGAGGRFFLKGDPVTLETILDYAEKNKLLVEARAVVEE